MEKANLLINDLEQYGRTDMLDIRGIPRQNNEDIDKIIDDIASTMGLRLKNLKLTSVTAPQKNKNAPIIVKSFTKRTRDLFLSKRRNLHNKTSIDIDILTLIIKFLSTKA